MIKKRKGYQSTTLNFCGMKHKLFAPLSFGEGRGEVYYLKTNDDRLLSANSSWATCWICSLVISSICL